MCDSQLNYNDCDEFVVYHFVYLIFPFVTLRLNVHCARITYGAPIFIRHLSLHRSISDNPANPNDFIKSNLFGRGWRGESTRKD